MIDPMLHRRRRQIRLFNEEFAQTRRVSGIEDLASLDVAFEAGPARESVLTGDRQLRASQGRRRRHGGETSHGGQIAALHIAEQILGETTDLLEARMRREGRHGTTPLDHP